MHLLLSAVLFSSFVFANANYPDNPDTKLTPGSLCTNPDSRRYPEKIAYCRRDVSSGDKWRVIENYNSAGYHIDKGNRNQFKIDHLIPLCAGGSNEMSNLWPQHQTVYAITDPLEPLLCGKMAEGVLKQARAVEIVRYAKQHLDEVPAIIKQLEAM